MNIILGISAYYHDSAAVLLVNGKIIAAAQEERFTRVKNTSEFPTNAVKYCLSEGNIKLADLSSVVFYDKPFLKFERLLENFYAVAPKGLFAFLKFLPEWSQTKIFLKSELKKSLKACEPEFTGEIELLFSSHHLSHAASAFYPSPFEDAAILTIDAVGEWATASIAHGKGSDIKMIKEMHFPDSVGLLYSSFTFFLGFKVNSGEYKLMGLSPYGNAENDQTKKFIVLIKSNLVLIHEDGSIKLNQKFFKYTYGLRMIREKKWIKLFDLKRRLPADEIEQTHANLALAIQIVTEEIILKMAKTAKDLTNSNNLCLAGGVALNSVANGKLLSSKLFANIWVQPAAGDAGGALGAALAFHYFNNSVRIVKEQSCQDSMSNALLGPKISEAEISLLVTKEKLVPYTLNEQELLTFIAGKLKENKIVGWVRGRMEFGPRALGARSILASPYDGKMQSKLNQCIKFREDFRPFAPVMLREEAVKYFDLIHGAHYMQFVEKIKPEFRNVMPDNFADFTFSQKLAEPRTKFQAVSHVDYSSRIQVVEDESHPLFQLLHNFRNITGDGILINTSFNTNEVPIVCSAEDAFQVFKSTEMDFLVIENQIFSKEDYVGSN